jgi:hypothetical protein
LVQRLIFVSELLLLLLLPPLLSLLLLSSSAAVVVVVVVEGGPRRQRRRKGCKDVCALIEILYQILSGWLRKTAEFLRIAGLQFEI